MKKLLIPTTAILTFAGAAFAAMPSVDADGDGVASFTEMLAVYPTLTEEGFGAMDTNSDGVIDEAEMTVAIEGGLIPEA